MNIAIPGIDWLMTETIAKLNRRCEEMSNEITALHNTLCLVMTQLEGLERRFCREQIRSQTDELKYEEVESRPKDDEGWTLVERRRGRT